MTCFFQCRHASPWLIDPLWLPSFLVQRFAEDVVAPRVEQMDEAEKMDSAIIKGLFEQGLMAIETDPEHGGAGGSFTSAIIVIEELAKIDPSVSVLCDVHNTLVNTVIRKYASKELQDKYLPPLSTDTVSLALSATYFSFVCA